VRRLHCPTCANEVFFDSLECVRCRTSLAMVVDGEICVIDAAGVLPCARRETWGCNWTAVGPGAPLCHSCVLVDAGGRERDLLMASLQSAQRRALYQLDVLGVPWTIGVRFIYR